MSRPYLLQTKRPPVAVKISSNAAALSEAISESVPLVLPLKTVYQEFPTLQKIIAKWDAKLESHKEVLTITPSFGKALTRIEVIVQKTKVKAFIKTVSPVNDILSKLMRRLNLAPNLNFDKVHSIAGTASTRPLGAYLALPMPFLKLLPTAPAVVLENERYDMLIRTQFL